MRCRPKLQISESVVGSVSIDVMDLFVGCQGSTQMMRHHESMLADPRRVIGQVTDLSRYRYVPVAVVCNCAYAPNFLDGHVHQRIAMSENAFVMGGAKAFRLVRAITSSHGAGGAWFTQRRVENQSAVSEQSLVVPVTEAFGIDLLVAPFDLAFAPPS